MSFRLKAASVTLIIWPIIAVHAVLFSHELTQTVNTKEKYNTRCLKTFFQHNALNSIIITRDF